MNERSMNTMLSNEDPEILKEYTFDYSRGVRGKYAGKVSREQESVLIDKDILEFFQTQEALNMALRHIIVAIPQSRSFNAS
jgi:uncharacterized protein (DUF4415 family)